MKIIEKNIIALVIVIWGTLLYCLLTNPPTRDIEWDYSAPVESLPIVSSSPSEELFSDGKVYETISSTTPHIYTIYDASEVCDAKNNCWGMNGYTRSDFWKYHGKIVPEGATSSITLEVNSFVGCKDGSFHVDNLFDKQTTLILDSSTENCPPIVTAPIQK